MKLVAFLYRFLCLLDCCWIGADQRKKKRENLLYLLLLSNVACLFAYCYYSSIDGKGKWTFEVSKQASKQVSLGYIGITCWLDCGRGDEVYTHHITSRWKERIIRVIKRPPLSF